MTTVIYDVRQWRLSVHTGRQCGRVRTVKKTAAVIKMLPAVKRRLGRALVTSPSRRVSANWLLLRVMVIYDNQSRYRQKIYITNLQMFLTL